MTAYPRNAGWISHPSLPITMVQCCGIADQERWLSLLLYRFLTPEHQEKE